MIHYKKVHEIQNSTAETVSECIDDKIEQVEFNKHLLTVQRIRITKIQCRSNENWKSNNHRRDLL